MQRRVTKTHTAWTPTNLCGVLRIKGADANWPGLSCLPAKAACVWWICERCECRMELERAKENWSGLLRSGVNLNDFAR